MATAQELFTKNLEKRQKSDLVMFPVGTLQTGASINPSAITLTRPSGTQYQDAANTIIIECSADARYTIDGTTPTATVGFKISANTPATLYIGAGVSIKVFSSTASSTAQYQWIRV